MGYEFDEDTRVESEGAGLWRAHVTSSWDAPVGPPNGGYLLAAVARAMGGELDRPDPVSITAHFLAPAPHGPARVEVEPLRVGGRHASAVATLRSGETEVLRAMGVFTDLSRANGPTLLLENPPELPAPEDGVSTDAEGGEDIRGRFEFRMRGRDTAWVRGEPTGVGEWRSWARFADGRPMDTLGLLVTVDAFAPAVFDLDLPIRWVPTLELTAHVRRRPAPGWVRCRVRTRFVTDGYFEEDVEIWDADDHLVAMSRQLALAPRVDP